MSLYLVLILHEHSSCSDVTKVAQQINDFLLLISGTSAMLIQLPLNDE